MQTSLLSSSAIQGPGVRPSQGTTRQGAGCGRAAEDGDGVVVRVEVAGEDLAYLSAAAGDDDSHVGFISGWWLSGRWGGR